MLENEHMSKLQTYRHLGEDNQQEKGKQISEDISKSGDLGDEKITRKITAS